MKSVDDSSRSHTQMEETALAQLIDLAAYPVRTTLKILLQDKTTKQNIIWATDAYSDHPGCRDIDQILPEKLIGPHTIVLQPRINKAEEEQQARTRKKAEVFTPIWICNQMNNHLDEEWFGRKAVFNVEDDHFWHTNSEKVVFPENRTWKQYLDSRRLEITCGEAPYLVSRYDAATGELIVPPIRRIGLLDRKLRIVNENTEDFDDWVRWTERAFQSCYGFEYQGDSLLIARINLIMTFYDYFVERWQKDPDAKLLRRFANTIAWNLWQMDGFTDTVPLGKPQETEHQINMFEFLGEDTPEDRKEAPLCKIYDWRAEKSVVYKTLKG